MVRAQVDRQGGDEMGWASMDRVGGDGMAGTKSKVSSRLSNVWKTLVDKYLTLVLRTQEPWSRLIAVLKGGEGTGAGCWLLEWQRNQAGHCWAVLREGN